VILDSHSSIAVPHPTGFITDFFKVEGLYGDLDQDRNFKQLVKDMVTHVNLHNNPWPVKLDPRKIYSSCQDRSGLAIFEQIYSLNATVQNKRRWGCKNLRLFCYFQRVVDFFPNAQFIYLIRDPRDVALSYKKVSYWNRNIMSSAQAWSRDQRTGIQLIESYPSQVFFIKYEDLIRTPREVIKKNCDFLGESFEPTMLDYYKNQEARKSSVASQAWQNIGSPIIRDNTQKYKKELTPLEIEIIEKITYKEMVHFGYLLDYYKPRFNDFQAYSFPISHKVFIYFNHVKCYLKSMRGNLIRLDEYLRRRKKTLVLSLIFLRCLLNRLRMMF